MKKNKVIIPAMALILFSTAASISGTVAWFTANRTFNMTAGDFAVVNTKDNLESLLTEGFGTDVSGERTANPGAIVVETSPSQKKLTLTDASFDHTTGASSAEPTIYAPDGNGEKVIAGWTAAGWAVNGGIAHDWQTARDTSIYNAFTWDITFKVSFSSTATNALGLYFDLEHSWMHEVVVTAANSDGTGLFTDAACSTPASNTATNYFSKALAVGDSGTGWYTDSDCADEHQAPATITAADTYYHKGVAAGTYYKATPDDTGKGFRIAILPKVIPSSSLGLTKVWGAHQAAATIELDTDDDGNPDAAGNGAGFVDGLAANAALVKSVYGSSTTSLVSSTWSTATSPAYMTGSTAVPAAPKLKASALGDSHYLGFFEPTPGGYTEMTFTCVAFFDGTSEYIVNTSTTEYETMTSKLAFEVITVTDE